MGAEGERFPRIRVAAVIIEDSRILLIRHEKGPNTYWLVPGGGVEYGEALETALKRELKEETNLDIRVRDIVLVNDSVAPDGSRHVVNIYFTAEAVGGDLAVEPDERVREAAWFTAESLKDMPLYPDIREELIQVIGDGSRDHGVYLGTRWKDMA